jgi:AcrR family transcriptional regulator
MEEKQELIINVAESQFIRFGFRKTTMEDIAKAAGIGKATLYYYFKSKEDIFAAMIEKVAQSALKQVIGATNTGKTPQEKFRIFWISQAQFIKEKVDYYAALREDLLELFPSIRRKQEKAEGSALAALRGILAEGVDRHVFAIPDVEATARILLFLMQGLTQRIIIEENWATWEDVINLFLELVVKGLEVRD